MMYQLIGLGEILVSNMRIIIIHSKKESVKCSTLNCWYSIYMVWHVACRMLNSEPNDFDRWIHKVATRFIQIASSKYDYMTIEFPAVLVVICHKINIPWQYNMIMYNVQSLLIAARKLSPTTSTTSDCRAALFLIWPQTDDITYDYRDASEHSDG